MDDLVESVLDKIPDLDNTYVIFSSDHGYHMGQFGMTIDKRQLYEFDIREDIFFRASKIVLKVSVLQGTSDDPWPWDHSRHRDRCRCTGHRLCSNDTRHGRH